MYTTQVPEGASVGELIAFAGEYLPYLDMHVSLDGWRMVGHWVVHYKALALLSHPSHSQSHPIAVIITLTCTFLSLSMAGHRDDSFLDPGNKSSKVFSKISDGFAVDDTGTATYEGTAFATTAGAVTSTLIKGSIS